MLDVLDTSEPITKVFFVRHGQTKANKLGLIFGQWDISLNENGIKQAKRAGELLYKKLKDEKINAIFSSPLKRTIQTASIISRKFKIKNIKIDKNLIEKSEGTWEGFSYWDIRKKDSKNYFKWLKDPYLGKPPGGESVPELHNRIKKFHKLLLTEYNGKNVIVVSHSGPIRMFLHHILGTKYDKYWHLKVQNGSVSEVHISKKHSMIWSMNLT